MPSPSSRLEELAAKCEQATVEQQSWILKDAGNAIFGHGSDAEQMRRFFRHIRNGAFLDAAMTLMDPEAWFYVERIPCGEGYSSSVGSDHVSRAATPALALCAAALRALAKLKGEGNE
jgi:hypothetical protein